MKWLAQFFSRKKVYSDLSEEIREHLEQKVEELVAAGMRREEAVAAARREFGNVTLVQERGREVWQWPSLESFLMDFRYALRQLHRNFGLTTVVVLTLAVGIGANTTIFSWMRAVLLNPLPGASDAAKVVAIESVAPSGEWAPVSYPDFRDLRDNAKLLESMTVAYPMALAVGRDTNVERISSELVSGNFFDVLGIEPYLGRFFSSTERDDAQNAHPVAVISDSLWATHFNSDPGVVGQTITINRNPYTIIGVAPRAFHGSLPGLEYQMWVPATMFSQLNSAGTWMLENRKTRTFRVLARLSQGATTDQARAEVRSIASHLAEANRDTSAGMTADVLPMWRSHWGIQDSLRAPLSILMGACGVVLLIVCGNMANLLLANATSRQKEFSVRLALGAPRRRLIRQLLTETFLLAAAGSLLGLLCTVWLTGSLRWLVPQSASRGLVSPSVDLTVILFTAALAIAVAILAGIAPALHGAQGDVNDTLKETGRGGTGSGRSVRVRSVLVASEMALAVIAIIGAGLFLKSFHLASTVRPGFDADHVAIARFSMSSAGYNAQEADAFCRQLRERLERQPGVTAVSYADYVPLSVAAGSWEDLQIEGYVPGSSENMKIYRSVVAPGYFGLLKIPVLEGREFTLNDDVTHEPVLIVNQEFVRRFMRDQYAIGRKVNGWGKWFTVVGVVQDSKIYRLTENPIPYFYVPMRQIYRPEFVYTFYVRTAGPIDDAVATLTRQAQAVDPAMPPFHTMALSEFISASLFQEKIAASLLSILATIAFVLAGIGLYGVMAYAVARRTKEIGIRVALGAQRAGVLQLVLRQATAFLIFGLTAGLIGAAVLARLVSAMLFSVSPADLTVYGLAVAVTFLIATVATIVPAIRAMRVDPMVALRYE